jgi:hypothetical protein
MDAPGKSSRNSDSNDNQERRRKIFKRVGHNKGPPVGIARGTDSRSDAAAGSAKGVLKSGTSAAVIVQDESGLLETTSTNVDITKVGPAEDERTLRISKDIGDFSQNLRAKRSIETFQETIKRLQKAIPKDTTQPSFQILLQDFELIGDMSSMAQQLVQSIRMFQQDRETQKENQNNARRGKNLLKSWIHKVSGSTGQAVLSMATIIAGVRSL